MALVNFEFRILTGRSIFCSLPSNFTMNDVVNLARDKIGGFSDHRFIICGKEILESYNEAESNSLRNLITDHRKIYAMAILKGGCFLPETLVICADRSQVPINNIQPGDHLLAFNNTGEIVTTTVQEVLVRNVDDYIELQVGEDNKVSITPDHWIYVGSESFTQLNNLRLNDSLFILSNAGDSLNAKPIVSFNMIKAPSTCVYNLHTAEPHTYFANGIAVHNMSGGMGSSFVDVSNEQGLQRIQFSTTAPQWRIVEPGLCLEGKCLNASCVAHQRQVIINIGFKEFNVLTDANAQTSKCPMCLQYVEPSTCGFNNCLWRWWGIKKPQRGSPPVEIAPCHWKEINDSYDRFDEERSGSVIWLKLILEASSKFRI